MLSQGLFSWYMEQSNKHQVGQGAAARATVYKTIRLALKVGHETLDCSWPQVTLKHCKI